MNPAKATIEYFERLSETALVEEQALSKDLSLVTAAIDFDSEP